MLAEDKTFEINNPALPTIDLPGSINIFKPKGLTILVIESTKSDFDGNFSLYLGLNELSRLFEDNLYVMIFWTHFIAINLFLGGWIVKDSQKFYHIINSHPYIMFH